MTTGTSTIRVSILGDAKKLVGAVGEVDKSLGGMGKTLLKGAIALGAIREGFGFAQDAIGEADRLGDATKRLELQIGDLSAGVVKTAGSYRDLGLSSQDVLELAANFADIATAAELSDQTIAANAAQVAALGQAVALLGDQSPEAVVELIGKAAAGGTKPLKELGVTLNDTDVIMRALANTGKDNAKSLTEQELATARLALIMEQLQPKLTEATTGTGDLEQAQAKLDASVEELQGKLGGPLSDALQAVVGFINDEIDAIPGAIDGFTLLGQAIGDSMATALTPIARVNDALGALGDLIADVNYNLNHIGANTAGRPAEGESGNIQGLRNYNSRNGLSGAQGSP